MGRIIWPVQVSADGYFEGPHGSLEWHQVDDELHEHFNATLAPMAGFLDGRVTWELMARFWPTADLDPGTTAPMATFAKIWREMPKIVYSTTLEHAGWNTTVVRGVVPADVAALREHAAGDLALGGADLAATFLAHGLVDELWLYVHPVLVGGGRRAFGTAGMPMGLHLRESRTFGNGVVLLRYQMKRDERHAPPEAQHPAP